MKNTKYILAILSLIAFSFLFSGCSDNDRKEKKELKIKNKIELELKNLEFLENSGIITQEKCEQASVQVVKYHNKGFWGKYWWNIGFILYLFIASSSILVLSRVEPPMIWLRCYLKWLLSWPLFGHVPRTERIKPMKCWKPYVVWLLSWPICGHVSYLYLRNMYNYKNKYHFIFIKLWISSSLLLLLLFVFSVDNYIGMFYNMPSVFFAHVKFLSWFSVTKCYLVYCVLVVFFCVNFIGGLILIPYLTYIFNYKYFRHHYDNKNILLGKEINSEKICKEAIYSINRVSDVFENIKKMVNDESCIIKDPERDDSFWGGVKRVAKNIITFGGASKLEKEMDRLRLMCSCCRTLEKYIIRLEDTNIAITEELDKCRIVAYRNMYLAKELIQHIKSKIKTKDNTLVVDARLNISKPSKEESLLGCFVYNDINFFTDDYLVSLEDSMVDAFDDLNYQMEKNGKLTKDDVVVEGIVKGTEVAIKSIVQVFKYNSQVKRERVEVQKQIGDIYNYISKVLDDSILYRADSYRRVEIITALIECNKAFVLAYEELNDIVFAKPSFFKFITGKRFNKLYLNDAKFRDNLNEKIQHLCLVCSEYNKINESKVLE